MVGVIARIMMGPNPGRPAAETTNNRLTGPWWAICTKCWQLDPVLRPSMSDILIDIEGVGPSLLEEPL